MKTSTILFKSTLAFYFTLGLLSCSKDSIFLSNPNEDVSIRTCTTISDEWLSDLRQTISDEFSIPDTLEYAVILKADNGTISTFAGQNIPGLTPGSQESVLIVAKVSEAQDEYIGYFDSSNTYCATPDSGKFITGKFEDIVSTTLNIIGADGDVF